MGSIYGRAIRRQNRYNIYIINYYQMLRIGEKNETPLTKFRLHVRSELST